MFDVPRDQQAGFDLQLITTYQRCFHSFGEKIMLMYPRARAPARSHGHMYDLYGIDMLPDLLSAMINEVAI